MPFESGRRLCLMFEAGTIPFAVEATAVMEVSSPDPSGDSLRGVFELQDLSAWVQGVAEERPGMAVVLDVSPTLAVRVRRVLEVADVARAPVFRLPPGVAPGLALLCRGALLHAGRLFLELVPDALPHWDSSRVRPPLHPVFLLDDAPEQALLFESAGQCFGVPLALVSQVVPVGGGYCSLRHPGSPVAGLLPHEQSLWPVFSLAGLMGGEVGEEGLVVLTELAGQNVGLQATRVLGVAKGLRPTGQRGSFDAESARGVLFLDLQRMFS